MQPLLKKQPCFYIPMFVFLFLCKLSVIKPVLIGRVNKNRVVLHPFSHSSIKQKLCNLQKSVQQFMPLFLFEVPLTSGRSRTEDTEVVCSLAQRLFEIAGRWNIQGDWQRF